MEIEKNPPKIDPDLLQRFEDEFGGTPSAFIRVPGRVNIIGERKHNFLTILAYLRITFLNPSRY